MKKQTLLIILLVVFAFGAFSVSEKLLASLGGDTELNENNEYISTSVEDGTSLYEDDYNISDGEYEEDLSLSGDVVDLIDDDIPCIYGSPDDLYDKNEMDSYISNEGSEDDYYKSNYGTLFPKLMTCWNTDREISFSLQKKFSTLSFKSGLWDKENNIGFMVIIYMGNQSKKKIILKAKRNPGQKPKTFSVDVSNCDTITIKTVSNDYYTSYAVTDGFKLTYK